MLTVVLRTHLSKLQLLKLGENVANWGLGVASKIFTGALIVSLHSYLPEVGRLMLTLRGLLSQMCDRTAWSCPLRVIKTG